MQKDLRYIIITTHSIAIYQTDTAKKMRYNIVAVVPAEVVLEMPAVVVVESLAEEAHLKVTMKFWIRWSCRPSPWQKLRVNCLQINLLSKSKESCL